MGNVIEVRGVKIGEGIPKICVPIVGKTKEEILNSARSFENAAPDIVEWRVDWFEGVFDFQQVEDVLKELRGVLAETPILFTFRTSKEGGEKSIDVSDYVELNKMATATGLADLVDVEVFTGDEVVKDIVKCAHEHGVKVVASNHDFDKTPCFSDMMNRLEQMEILGADICKLAVMPITYKDVITLLNMTLEMSHKLERPIVTMAMGKIGVISRITGELTGSSMTFASAGKISAPGQMNVIDMQVLLEAIHHD